MRSSFELEIEKIFSADGLLSAASNYEYRPEQQRMACQVARTLQSGGHLVVEAGTGVGKSLAYLVPAAILSTRLLSPRSFYRGDLVQSELRGGATSQTDSQRLEIV